MQNDILEQHRQARLRVYALWTNKLFLDSRSAWDGDGLDDHRVVHLWDGKDIAGDWIRTHVPGYQGSDWDSYLLFGPHAVWTATPHPLLSSGSTVIGSSGQLQAAITPLLRRSRNAGGQL